MPDADSIVCKVRKFLSDKITHMSAVPARLPSDLSFKSEHLKHAVDLLVEETLIAGNQIRPVFRDCDEVVNFRAAFFNTFDERCEKIIKRDRVPKRISTRKTYQSNFRYFHRFVFESTFCFTLLGSSVEIHISIQGAFGCRCSRPIFDFDSIGFRARCSGKIFPLESCIA